MERKLKGGVVGATGMVGQRYVSLLAGHPWFDLVTVAASPRSAGKPYAEAVENRWVMPTPLPAAAGYLTVKDASRIDEVSGGVDFIFCAVDMPKQEIRDLEDRYAKAETPVVSNNSAHRLTPDVPMLIPEINAHHLGVVEAQRKRLGVKRGFITVKPNCSIQAYVPALHPLLGFGVEKNLRLHLSGDLRGGQDLQGLARNGGQRDPLHRRGRVIVRTIILQYLHKIR